jgi:hypothetical protein
VLNSLPVSIDPGQTAVPNSLPVSKVPGRTAVPKADATAIGNRSSRQAGSGVAGVAVVGRARQSGLGFAAGEEGLVCTGAAAESEAAGEAEEQGVKAEGPIGVREAVEMGTCAAPVCGPVGDESMLPLPLEQEMHASLKSSCECYFDLRILIRSLWECMPV